MGQVNAANAAALEGNFAADTRLFALGHCDIFACSPGGWKVTLVVRMQARSVFRWWNGAFLTSNDPTLILKRLPQTNHYIREWRKCIRVLSGL
jgi:hypothetical protein